MFIQPVYNILLLPDVTYYFKKDFFSVEADNVKGDTDVLFLMLKNETENRSPVSDDFYPIGVSARIESVSDEAQARIDWNKVWSKKYPVLGTYHKTVRINDYAPALREMLTQLRVDYGYNHTDALLVLKDILARVWKGQM